jgi:hypothetical protein
MQMADKNKFVRYTTHVDDYIPVNGFKETPAATVEHVN